MKHLWYVLYPGVCVAVVGLEALILTVFPALIAKKWNRAIAVFLAFALTVTEITVLKIDRQETRDYL